MRRRFLPVHALTKCIALLTCGLLGLAFLSPFASAVGGRRIRASRAPSQEKVPLRRLGAPEGVFPNIDEAKVRPSIRPRAALHIPSTVRAKRNPLVPRNGRRVGDPFPTPTPLPSPLASPLPSRLPSPSPLPSRVGHFNLEPPDLPDSKTDRPIDATTLRNLVAWNPGDYQSLSIDSLFLEKLGWPEWIADSGFRLSEGSDVAPANGTFDFFAVPMPQAQSSKIVFATHRDGNAEIYSMDADGNNQIRLTNNSSNDENPRWSANGAKILFQSDRDNPETGNYDIYVMNADGTGQTRLTLDAADDCNAIWSPDGSKIAFQSLRNGSYYQVYVMNTDGTSQANVTNGIAADSQPSWSPDGTKLAFVSERDHAGRSSIYVMNANGSNQTRLTFSADPFKDEQPVWSRDGSKIAFVSTRDSIIETWQETDDDGNILNRSAVRTNKEVYVMNADGSSQLRLTNTLEPDDAPYWSPDGTKIVFRSDRERDCCDPTPQLWTMNADGSSQALLTSNAYSDYSPSWTITGNQAPVANAAGPYSGMTAQAVQFNGSGSFDPDGSITSYAWNFGDNTSGSGISPTHAYTSVGSYTVTLTVTDNLGAQASATTTATITGNQPPVANAGGPYSAMAGQTVQFNGSGSFDPDGSIASYAWNFGDNANGSGVSPTHAYASVGTYTVTLTVTDNLGSQASATTTATIATNAMEPYAANFSQWALLRQPTSSESVYWNDIFRAAYQNGQGSLVLATREFGRTLFESSEYAARNRSDRDYVYDLYKSYLMREPDQQGWDNWTLVVPSYGREHVRRGFDESWEFLNLMATMTAPGSVSSAVSSLSSARVDPKNQPGNGLLARDVEWSLPLLSLPGRAGLDLGLSLSYSSMVWTRSGPYFYFDEDIGSPSPGFRLGFPAIQEKFFDAQVGKNVYVMIMSSGRRVELRQVGTSNVYEAGDSSYLQLIDNGTLLVRSTDGTQLSYGWFDHEFRCTEIKDRNGNYLTINYNWLGDITTITDTLGRVITFNYDANANPSSITQTWNGQTHTWATFGWGVHTMQSSFSSVSVVGAPNGSTLPVLTQVGLHDGSRYNFEYTGVGQVNVIRHFTFDNMQRAYTAYDYQSTADDCPRISATRVWAENWTGINDVPNEVVTQYSELGDGSHQVIAPDGTVYKEFYAGSAGFQPADGWARGLIAQIEVWSDGIRQKWTTLNWTQDNLSVTYQTNPRVTESNVYDSSGNRRRTEIAYTSFNLPNPVALPTEVKEYAADATTVLRRTATTYFSGGQAYIDRRVLGLLREVIVYDENNQPVSKVWYDYDWGSDYWTALPATVTQHDGGIDHAGRGNLCWIGRWDVADVNNFDKTQRFHFRYNRTGSLIRQSDPLWHEVNISYTDSFADGVNRNTFAYPTMVTDADGFSSQLQYNFDFGAKTRVQGPPPAGQPQGLIQTLTYDSAARIERVTTTNNDAYTRFVYGPDYVQSFTTVNTVADEAYAFQVFDGVGRIRAAGRNHPGSVGGYSAQESIYDSMGRAVKQSNPTEITGAWAPAGDDAAGWLYTQQTYDWQGRPLVTTNTDGTTKEASYGGCGCAGGEVVTLTDEGTIDAGVFKRRQQKVYSDVLGRPVKTEVLNWQGGSVYSATVNTYNARNQVTLARQYAGVEGSSTFQDTSMTYDGYGRLKTRHVPEQDAGSVTTWDYNSDDTVQKGTDARGASQTFSYNARHLVTAINHAAPSGITIPAPSSFGYDAAGNRIFMSDASGSTNYQYNQLSQLQTETREFGSLFGSYTLSYEYNLAGMLTKITDPTNSSINYGYDAAGRLNNVGGADNLYAGVSQYASGLAYRAWGAIKGLTYGNNYTLAVNYNSRLQGTQFEVSGRPAPFGPSTVMKTQFEYYADGAVKYAHDLLDERFDRTYRHDHVSRLKEAYTGSEARDFVNGTSGGTQTGPYRQTYQHDVFSNITQRDSRFWSENDSLMASYTNHRRAGFVYDQDGRLTQDSDLQYSYDAVGRNVTIFSAQQNRTVTSAHDGDGRVTRRTETQWSTTHTYYVRSSVLGGRVVTELNQNGQKQKGYVLAGSQVLAEQEGNLVKWRHENPVTGSRGLSFADGNYGYDLEPDPMGINVGLEDPFLTCCIEPPTDPVTPMLLGDSGSCGANPNCTRCYLDGFEIGCDRAMHMLDIGAADLEVTLNNGRRVAVPVQSFGVGVFRIWIPGRSGNSSNEIDYSSDIPTARTNNSTPGHWEIFSFNFGPQNSQQRRHHPGPQNPRPTPTPCPGSIPEGIARLILRIASQEGIDPTLLSVAMRHESSFGTNMTPNERWEGRGRNRRLVGWDVGPMQLATNIWQKSPFIDGLANPFGTIAMNANTRQYESFNGNFDENVTVGARAFSMDILPRSHGRDWLHRNADASGMYRGPGDYQGRYNQYIREAPGDRRQLNCMAGQR